MNQITHTKPRPKFVEVLLADKHSIPASRSPAATVCAAVPCSTWTARSRAAS
ncbi:hypothetical protein [Kribbella sp. VKM Ac-2569]|uniref:hypothetical protein n=1 Tax=Kribbella sp. VKM Ac-2569 TaxID=2512220 RepID=UPI001300484E|nr:hypothetical protein [Kribbella sp. VKM Ac-2569]